jgi:hypothetical protein
MLKPICVLLALLVASPLVNAEIFKCTRAGNAVYQNFPCDVDSIGSSATATAPAAKAAAIAASAPERSPSAVSGPKAAGAEESAPARIEPRIGLTRNQVRTSAWGEPIDIVKEDDEDGGTETWYYDVGRKRAILFDARGKVAEISR